MRLKAPDKKLDEFKLEGHPLDTISFEAFRKGNKISKEQAEKIFTVGKQISPFPKAFAKKIREVIDSSMTTDIVEFKTEEDSSKFIEYWTGMDMSDERMKYLPNIPGDLCISNTIPIEDIKIAYTKEYLDGVKEYCSVRIIYSGDKEHPECPILIIILSKDDPTYDDIIAVAGVQDEQITLCSWFGFYPKMTRPYNGPAEYLYMGINYDVIYTMLAVWYGIQLALTHPVVKEVFANPNEVKRDKYEYANYHASADKKSKMKYVKKHYVTKENSIDAVISKKLNELNKIPRERPFTRKTLLWRVIGHYRVYPDGRKLWIAPYWKGIMKDSPHKDIILEKENEREIVTE